MPTDLFDRIPAEQKLAFLKWLLEKDERLQREFELFVEGGLPPADFPGLIESTTPDTEAVISEFAEYVTEDLEALELSDSDWEHYVPRHSGYIPEWEAAEHMAEDEVEAVLDGFYFTLENHVREKRCDNAVLAAIGCFDACVRADLNSIDDVLPDAEGFMLSVLQTMTGKLGSLLEIAHVPHDQLYTLAWAIFHHAQVHYSEDARFLQLFQGLMINLVQSKEQALLVRRAFDENKLAPEDIPLLTMKVMQYLDDYETREKMAQQLSFVDRTVAGNLLQLYSDRGDKKKFLALANELWKRQLYRNDIATVAFTCLTPQDDPELYKEFVLHLAEQYRDEAYYRLLMDCLDQQERQSFMERFKHDSKFYTTMLRLEGLYQDALGYLDQKDHRDYTKLISQLTDHLPDRCFRSIKDKIMKTLVLERGKHVYENIVSCLKTAMTIPGYEQATHQLARELYNRKPALPSLRKEILAAGLLVP